MSHSSYLKFGGLVFHPKLYSWLVCYTKVECGSFFFLTSRSMLFLMTIPMRVVNLSYYPC